MGDSFYLFLQAVGKLLGQCRALQQIGQIVVYLFYLRLGFAYGRILPFSLEIPQLALLLGSTH